MPHKPLFLLITVALLAACPGGKTATIRPSPPLKVECKLRFVDSSPREAQVVVDGVVVGTLDELQKKDGMTIKPGVHRIEVRHATHRPYRIELKVRAAGEKLKVRLSPRRK
jgi:hypothetical protein